MSDDQEPPRPSNDEGTQRSRQQPERTGREHSGGGRRRHHQPPQQNQSRRPEASLNLDELRDLIELITANGLTDFELEREGFRVRLRRDMSPQATAAASAPAISTTPTTGQHATQAPLTQEPPISHSSSGVSGLMAGAATTESLATKHPGAQAEIAASEDESLYIIPSPIVGTFYRAASPTAETFVRIGSHVDPDTVVCIIEAMKLMNEIQAETTGEVVKIYIENGQPVEYGQPLFGIRK